MKLILHCRHVNMATLQWTYETPTRVWDLEEVEALMKHIFAQACSLRKKGIEDEEIRSILTLQDKTIFEFAQINSHATIFRLITTSGQALEPLLDMVVLRRKVEANLMTELEARKEYRKLETR